MIDQAARHSLADAVSDYLSCSISNAEFDRRIFSIRSEDPAIRNIRSGLWLLYDDLTDHKNEGKWKLSDADHAVLLRTILFLKSQFEYTWPSPPTWYLVARLCVAILTVGLGTKLVDKRFGKMPDSELWPFRSHSDISNAKEQSERNELEAAT